MINVSDAAGFNFSEQTCVQWVSVQNMGIFNYVCSLECQSLKGVVCSVVVAARRSIMQVWYVILTCNWHHI